ncbi:MAG: hypothetical protein ACAI34_19770, partial [Verrucomicrobium sp.]
MEAPQELRESLTRLRNRVRGRLRLRGALVLIAGWTGLAILCGLLDAWLGFEFQGRRTIAGLLVAAAAVGTIVVVWRSFRFSLGEVARHVDAVTADPRGLASIGSDLAHSKSESTPSLQAFLARRALAEAVLKLRSLPHGMLTRKVNLRPAVVLLTVAGIVVTVLAVWQPKATALIAQRLFSPSRDLPPYSPFEFNLDPSEPRVIYGKSLALAAEITGAPLDGTEVHLLTRPVGGGAVDRLPVFREAGHRFAQKLEGVTSP